MISCTFLSLQHLHVNDLYFLELRYNENVFVSKFKELNISASSCNEEHNRFLNSRPVFENTIFLREERGLFKAAKKLKEKPVGLR